MTLQGHSALKQKTSTVFSLLNAGYQIACVASVSARLSARSMHFSLFWPRENWGGRKKVLPSVLRSPQFLRSQKAKSASNGRKALRKRLQRRLGIKEEIANNPLRPLFVL